MENRNGFLYHDMMSSSEPIKIKWAFCSKTYGPNLGIEKQQGHFVRKQPVGSGLGGLKKNQKDNVAWWCVICIDPGWIMKDDAWWILVDASLVESNGAVCSKQVPWHVQLWWRHWNFVEKGMSVYVRLLKTKGRFITTKSSMSRLLQRRGIV